MREMIKKGITSAWVFVYAHLIVAVCDRSDRIRID